ncbi:MAG: PSD1 and planctomycete cytochrome C domain-containing protein [Pirellulales bacterium]
MYPPSFRLALALWALAQAFAVAVVADEPAPPTWSTDVAPLLKSRCVKCHGPATREAGLFLASAAGVARGSDAGPIVVPHDLSASPLWKQVEERRMPPEDPLDDRERNLLRRWILAGAPGLAPPRADQSVEADHWAFRPLRRPEVPAVRQPTALGNPIDRFLAARLEAAGLEFPPPANDAVWTRRARIAILGLPPTLDELAALDVATTSSLAERAGQVERWLASPQFGPRWAKRWLDAAGYADSNGYFGADTDRPLAYRYRDYVVESLNADLPLDQFVREQLAGDELAFAAGYRPGSDASPEIIRWLVATHFLRNGQDGSGESDGNPDEVRADRYYALESSQQIVGGSLLGLTIQCAKCHDHKFEPISQQDFYRLQAILYPAFPIESWVKPNDRFVLAPLPGETSAWETRLQSLDADLARHRDALQLWVAAHRPSGELLFADDFNDDAQPLSARWSSTAPHDDAPAGKVPVSLDSDARPGARRRRGALELLEGGTAPNAWLSTRESIDWTPAEKGDSVQVTFDLLADRVDDSEAPAARIGYYVALHDYDDSSPVVGGNILIDGHPSSSSVVDLDYPGADSKALGQIGVAGYRPGRNYGVRITNLGEGKYQLEHLVDFVAEDKSLTLMQQDLPDGGFGFEFCCGRSFVVDNVRIERFASNSAQTLASFLDELRGRRQTTDALQKERATLQAARPGKIAWLSDVGPQPPPVHLLTRGNYATRGETVEPAGLAVLSDSENPFTVAPSGPPPLSSGRRLGLARWLTHPGSRPAALLARVQANRIWQHYFGVGLVATTDNLGLGGAEPSHPELLEWLAVELVESGWSFKHLHRLIAQSAAFGQSSHVSEAARRLDPSNRLYSRFPLQRLDAEALRDGMLSASGEIDLQLGGPYIPTHRNGEGEVHVDESSAGARRRSLYLYQRRTQQLSLLSVFDAPSIVFLSTQRSRSTTPLQSLAQWNSEFVVNRASALAQRSARVSDVPELRVDVLYQLVFGRRPTSLERRDALAALHQLQEAAEGAPDAELRAWRDLAQALFMSNEYLYGE